MKVRRDRIRLRYVTAAQIWEIVQLPMGDEEPVVLATFYTGRKGEPGTLARWAFEHLCVSEKA